MVPATELSYRLSKYWWKRHSGLLASNAIPLLGAIFLGWEPLLVILIYAMETIIAGIFNIIKMITVIGSSKAQPGQQSSYWSWALVPFFILHYNFFVMVQLTMLLGMAEMWGLDLPSGLLNLPQKIGYVLDNQTMLGLGGIATGYLYDYIWNYLRLNRYLETSADVQMMEVYPRIIVQQFVVILGGWFLLLPHSAYFVLGVLVIVKSYAEMFIVEKGDQFLSHPPANNS